MTAKDRAEGVTVSFAYSKRQGLQGEDLRQKLQDSIECAIRDAVAAAMHHREKTDDATKLDAELFRWLNASPAHYAAAALEMERNQHMSLRDATREARRRASRRKEIAA